MSVKQIFKRVKKVDVPIVKNKEVSTVKNNIDKKEDTMDINEINKAEELAKTMNKKVKIVKKEKGLIERTETEKVVLTEDNRQVLTD